MSIGLLVAVFAVLSTACVSSNSVACDNGRVCPAGSTCDEESGRCLVPEQFAVCATLADHASCQFQGLDGTCIRGACFPSSCGDGIVSGAEECDGDALGMFDDCGDLGYYDESPLACGTDCRYDRSSCTAGLCGDDIRNGPEVCDGSDLELLDCTDLGFYEPGPLTCNDACAYNTSECHGYCGDAMLNGSEVCEAGLPIVETCTNFGYDRGYLACTRCLADISSCRYIGWRRHSIPASTIVRAFDGTSRRNVYGAGSDGALLHYDGVRWNAMTPAAFDHFRAVAVLAEDHVIALGELGTIQRFNGTSWSVIFNDTSWRFNAVVQVGATEAFAVGNQGVLRYNGTTWTPFSAPGATELTDIYGTSASDLFTIDTAGVLSRYNGSAWQTQSLPGVGSAKPVAVFGSGPGNVWVATTPNSAVYRLSGTSWQSMGITITGTLTTGASLGGNQFCVAGLQSSVWCYDGALWSNVVNISLGFGDLGAVFGNTIDDIFVAGVVGVQHFDGSWWFSTGYPASPLAFWGDATVLYGATVTGTVVKLQGASSFTTVLTPTNPVYGIWGSGPSDVFAVGQSGEIQRFNGSNWSKMTNSDSRNLLSAWGTGPTNVFAVGYAGAFLRYDGAWSAVPSGTNEILRDVWAASPSDVFAVGYGGTIVRYNGTSITTMASGTTRDLRAVYGFSATNIYAVGDVGTILHFDGATWTPIPAGTGARLNDVWGTSASDVFVVGELGVILHFDGMRWTPVKPQNAFANQLAIYGVTDELWFSISGVSGVVLERFAPW